MENTVEFLGYYGGDKTHALSAWTSTMRDYEGKKDKVPGLLEMLADNKHGTPFEKSCIHFLVNVDQATHIHLLKHRIGVAINGESARYKELKEDKTYLPEDWEIQSPTGTEILGGFKQGTTLYWKRILELHTEKSNQLYHQCLEELTPVLGRSRAKESARYFKMMNSQITMDVMFNWRSFYHFLVLRNDEHAQKEVRALANTMLFLVENIESNPFEHTLAAFKLKSDKNSSYLN